MPSKKHRPEEIIGKGRALFSMHDHRGTHVVKNGTEEWLESETTITGGYLHHEYFPARLIFTRGPKGGRVSAIGVDHNEGPLSGSDKSSSQRPI